MKILSLFLGMGLLLMVACKEDEPTPQQQTDKGCMTAVNGNGDRMFLRCCTQSQFNAGGNVSQGGYANWNAYTGHQWEKCPQCQ